MACAQKATSRSVSVASSPTLDLNHWRCSSTRDKNAMGVLQISDARITMASKSRSGGESRSFDRCRAFSRWVSFDGRRGRSITTFIRQTQHGRIDYLWCAPRASRLDLILRTLWTAEGNVVPEAFVDEIKDDLEHHVESTNACGERHVPAEKVNHERRGG